VADYVISNISPRMTLNLLDKKPKNKNYTYRPSNSLIGCFIGVDRSLGLDNMARKNYWWQTYPEIVNYNDPDMTKEPSMMYVCSETVNGVRYENVDPQLQSLTVFAPGNYAQSKAAYEKDPRIHDELRTEIEQVILETLEKKLFPGLRNSLKFIKVFTPWDIFQELGAEEGNIYGRREDVQSVLRKINPIAGINNLSLACATVGQPGITTGFQTSLIMVEKLTGRQIIG
jgi:phytoene dehydrogenase-like protein